MSRTTALLAIAVVCSSLGGAGTCVLASHAVVRIGGLDDRMDTFRAQLQAFHRLQDKDREAVAQLAASVPTDADIARCRDRTECLRATFETLIGVWPGRAKLPETCGAWPAWPTPGEMTSR